MPSQKGCVWLGFTCRLVCGVVRGSGVGEDSPESGGPAQDSPASEKMAGN